MLCRVRISGLRGRIRSLDGCLEKSGTSMLRGCLGSSFHGCGRALGWLLFSWDGVRRADACRSD